MNFARVLIISLAVFLFPLSGATTPAGAVQPNISVQTAVANCDCQNHNSGPEEGEAHRYHHHPQHSHLTLAPNPEKPLSFEMSKKAAPERIEKGSVWVRLTDIDRPPRVAFQA